MKYEHRDYIALIAVSDLRHERARPLLVLNPSAFTKEEISINRIAIHQKLKNLSSYATANGIPITPGLYIAVLNVRSGDISFTKFNMSMNTDIFREYKLEVQAKMEAYFGMEPEQPLLYVTPGEATPAYVNQDR